MRRIVISVGESTALFRVLVFPGIVENLRYVLDRIGEQGFFINHAVTAALHPGNCYHY